MVGKLGTKSWEIIICVTIVWLLCDVSCDCCYDNLNTASEVFSNAFATSGVKRNHHVSQLVNRIQRWLDGMVGVLLPAISWLMYYLQPAETLSQSYSDTPCPWKVGGSSALLELATAARWPTSHSQWRSGGEEGRRGEWKRWTGRRGGKKEKEKEKEKVSNNGVTSPNIILQVCVYISKHNCYHRQWLTDSNSLLKRKIFRISLLRGKFSS